MNPQSLQLIFDYNAWANCAASSTTHTAYSTKPTP